MSNKIFGEGFYFNEPHQNAPEWVIGSVSVDVDKFIDFLQKNKGSDGKVKLSLKKSQGGKVYSELDTYVKGSGSAPAASAAPPAGSDTAADEDLPF